MIIVTSITGSLLFFYSAGFAMGVLGNFFDVIERIKSGKPLVILLGNCLLCVLWFDHCWRNSWLRVAIQTLQRV